MVIIRGGKVRDEQKKKSAIFQQFLPTEFYEMDAELFIRVLRRLQQTRKAELMGVEGVKFF